MKMLFLILLLASCSFDYGSQDEGDKSQPDIVMENVDYVRVRSADPQARLQAERAERYEERRIMELRNISFEQFGDHGNEVNASGRAGSASFEIDSGDIRMDDGVRIEVESEDIILETKQLDWKDNARILSGGSEELVNVFQENGTTFTGTGFRADARRRTWEFSGSVNGTYIQDDEDEEEENDEEENNTEEVSDAVVANTEEEADGTAAVNTEEIDTAVIVNTAEADDTTVEEADV